MRRSWHVGQLRRHGISLILRVLPHRRVPLARCTILNSPLIQPLEPLMTYPRESTDIGQVVQALSNGLRSDVEIAGTARLSLDRVQIALIYLVKHKCVVGSPASRFRLTDNGYDMVKVANAAERKREALSARLTDKH